MRSVSSRLTHYIRRFPAFSMVGSLRHSKEGQQDPFGDNESLPEDSQLDDASSGSGEEDTQKSCGGENVGALGTASDIHEQAWEARESPHSLIADLECQGWEPATIALGVSSASASCVSLPNPDPSAGFPLPSFDDARSFAGLDASNCSVTLKRKRSNEQPAVTDAKKKLSGRKLKNKLKWAAKGKGIRKERRKEDSDLRDMVSTDPPSDTSPLPPHTNHSNPGCPRPSISLKYADPTVLKIDDAAIDEKKADLRNYSTKPGWICDAKKGKGEETKVPTLEEMKARGFQVVSFPESERLVALDKEENITVVLTGFPNDPSWRKSVVNGGKTMGKAGAISGVSPTPGSRGNIAVLTAGCTHYMGTEKPSNRTSGTASAKKAVELLRNDPDIKRVAAHQSALLGFYAPKEALYYDVTLDKLYRHDRTLRRPFKKSIYPSVAFNVDPNTVTLDHTDAGNYPVNLCAITAFGNYNHKLGGHIILYDLRLIIEFPVGYTFLIPSGAMRHGNTSIAPGETRYSMVQYCPGGLLRWVEHGFQNETSYVSSGGKKPSSDARWEQVLGKLSRLSELVKDHQLYRRGQ